MHGGRVAAESEGPGKGAKFSVWLPLVATPPLARKDESPAISVRPQRILVVDDNVDAADTLSILLSGDGHQTTTAYNATDALAQIAIFHPETIFIDIGLPDMNGYDMALQIQTTHAAHSMKLVALTGYGQSDSTPGAGFHAHLIKPVTPEDLRRILAEAMA
jgi:CheY-like chemotaxis protein